MGLLADAEDGEWVGGAGRLERYRLGGGVEEGAVDRVADLGGEAEEHCFDCWEGGYGRMMFVLGWLDRRKQVLDLGVDGAMVQASTCRQELGVSRRGRKYGGGLPEGLTGYWVYVFLAQRVPCVSV